jgi:transglutaminase-like putative cysteine protease
MRAQNPAEAHVIEQALRAAGIDSNVVGDYLDAGIGDIPGVRAEVWVHRHDLEAAKEVVREGGHTLDEEEEPEA